jgi:hypothetical protein
MRGATGLCPTCTQVRRSPGVLPVSTTMQVMQEQLHERKSVRHTRGKFTNLPRVPKTPMTGWRKAGKTRACMLPLTHSAAIAALASRPSLHHCVNITRRRAMLLRNTATSQQRLASAHQ